LKKCNDRICPEREILLWAIRADHQNEERVRQVLCEGIDWSVLKEQARKQNIIPLLYYRLKILHEPCGLPEIEYFFRDHYQANIYRNLMSAHQILWILKRLSNQGIHAIPIKGIVVALQAYKTPDMRQCGDIDILIHKQDLPHLIRILTESGFKPLLPFTKDIQASMVHFIMKSETFNARNRIDIDVHWKISDIFSSYPATDEFLQSARTISFSNGSIPTLPPEDALIMLSAHGMKHFWHELRHIADIIQLIKNNPGMDVESALVKAKRLRCLRVVSISLTLAHLLGGIEYDPPLSSHLNADPVAKKIANDIIRFHQNGEVPRPFTRIRSMTRSREHWLDALGFGLYALFSYTPPDGYNPDVPRPLRPFYFIVKPQWIFPDRHPTAELSTLENP
jgi:hypothetical protein